MRRITIMCAIALFAPLSHTALAQTSTPRPVEVLGQFTGVTSSEFSGTDVGIGGLVSWRALPVLSAEAEMNDYPTNLAVNGGGPFSSGRIEGLFGITAGPTLGRWRPFGSFRTGFVKFQSAPGPLACPAIFPPLLSCTLAKGEAVIAQEIGGGIEVFPAPHAAVRVELGDRLTHYPGASIDANGQLHNASFYRNEFRFAVGAGVRF